MFVYTLSKNRGSLPDVVLIMFIQALSIDRANLPSIGIMFVYTLNITFLLVKAFKTSCPHTLRKPLFLDICSRILCYNN